MSASIERFISPRVGGVIFLSSVFTGPGVRAITSSAWTMMRSDWRISSMRQR